MNLIAKIVIGCITMILLSQCSNNNDFSVIPEINTRSFAKVSDTLAVWKIGFTDGDGDIGVRNTKDLDNYFLTIYSIEDGVPVEFTTQTYRIPVVENIRTEKGIEGEFEFRFETDLFFMPTDSPIVDTAFLRAYVVDRANNQSNTLETPMFSITY